MKKKGAEWLATSARSPPLRAGFRSGPRSVRALRSVRSVARRAPARSCARFVSARRSSLVVRSSVLASRAAGIAGARRHSAACLSPASRRRAPLRAFLALFLPPLSSLRLACSSLPVRAALPLSLRSAPALRAAFPRATASHRAPEGCQPPERPTRARASRLNAPNRPDSGKGAPSR